MCGVNEENNQKPPARDLNPISLEYDVEVLTFRVGHLVVCGFKWVIRFMDTEYRR
jgi:hypothetical protein